MKSDDKSAKPLRIPLSFDDALGGLLRVDPKKLKKPAKEKRPVKTRKKRG